MISYFGRERLQLNERVVNDVIARFQVAFPAWDELITNSFLSPEKKEAYRAVVKARKARLEL